MLNWILKTVTDPTESISKQHKYVDGREKKIKGELFKNSTSPVAQMRLPSRQKKKSDRKSLLIKLTNI